MKQHADECNLLLFICLILLLASLFEAAGISARYNSPVEWQQANNECYSRSCGGSP